MSKTPEIFVDLDGVMADYEGEYRRVTGGDPSEKGKVKASRFKPFPNFYRNLPLLPDALQLWHFLKPYHPSILSAASNFVKASRQDKYEWVHEHLGLSGPKVIVVDYPNEKWKHCTPGAILIDDNAKNCLEWEQAGGVAIKHTSAANTIRKLKEILGHQNETVSTPNVVEAFQKLSKTIATPNLTQAFEELQEER
jgi:hypothetical protein